MALLPLWKTASSSEDRNFDSRGRLDHNTGKTSGTNSLGEIGENYLQGNVKRKPGFGKKITTTQQLQKQ